MIYKIDLPRFTFCLLVALIICFPSPSSLVFSLYRLSGDLFSSALYHLSSSRLILSRCLPLQLSREPGRLFQCMRPDNHSALILSAFLSSPLFSSPLLAGAVLMWGNALSFCSRTLFAKAAGLWVCKTAKNLNTFSVWKLFYWFDVLNAFSLSVDSAYSESQSLRTLHKCAALHNISCKHALFLNQTETALTQTVTWLSHSHIYVQTSVGKIYESFITELFTSQDAPLQLQRFTPYALCQLYAGSYFSFNVVIVVGTCKLLLEAFQTDQVCRTSTRLNTWF